MSKGVAPPGIVPRVFAEDGGGYAVAAKCPLCGERITRRTLSYGRLATDPRGLNRPLHRQCRREFELFTRALDLASADVTPCS
jgi:hypothetical protein